MKKIILLLTLLATLLTGCAVESNRIYTVCKRIGDITYCYDDEVNFYRRNNTGEFYSVPAVGLVAKPAMIVHVSDGDYSFVESLPNCYTGTLQSVEHYIFYLIEKDNVQFTTDEVSYSNVNFHLSCAEYSLKIFYTSDGVVRVYAVNSGGLPIDPPYIIGE